MRRFELRAAAATLAMTAAALAHPGPRIWVDVVEGKVNVFAGPYPPGDPALYHPASVFTQPLVDEGEDTWDTDFPGFQAVPSGHIPPGTTFGYNIMGPLLWYNMGDAVRCPFFEPVAEHFIDTPAVPQVVVTNELLQMRVTAAGLVAGDAVYAFHGNAGDHNHLTYMLLGDGQNPGGGPDGVYALQLQLTSGGYSPSDAFYLLLGKNAAPALLAEAASVVAAPRVPPDLDCDGDVDTLDLDLFEICVTGSAIPLPAPVPGEEYCVRADFDRDGDVDQSDFGIFQRCNSGPGVSPDPNCANQPLGTGRPQAGYWSPPGSRETIQAVSVLNSREPLHVSAVTYRNHGAEPDPIGTPGGAASRSKPVFPSGGNPHRPTTGSNRILHGGGWIDNAMNDRLTNRNSSYPGMHNNTYGFRLALNAE